MDVETLILGAGAAGMMCAAHAGPGVLVVDHARAPGEKIRISGGGRCNFTNLNCGPENFLSDNPHFCKSALSRYTQWDFIELLARHRIAWHEKTLGQLFCDGSARQVVAILREEMTRAGATLWCDTRVGAVMREGHGFRVTMQRDGQDIEVRARHLVLATGGKSIPKMGASGLAHVLARQFGLAVTQTRPALVPFTLGDDAMERLRPLAGVSVAAGVTAGGVRFDEAMLVTHRGLSGPAMLQASSFWREGDAISVDLLPGQDAFALLRARRATAGRRAVATHLGEMLPGRLAGYLAEVIGVAGNLADVPDARLRRLADALSDWRLRPAGTEGYRTAEVTLGGIDTAGLDSRTMAAKTVPGLYAIGEAVDVTGWLGGYNFQWAWSSGWAAGKAIAAHR